MHENLLLKMDVKIENDRENIDLICHGCLTTDRKVRRIRGEFLKMFQFLRNDDKIDVLSRELLLCWECVGFLKKLKMFRARIRKAECILVTYLQNYYNEVEYTTPQCLSSLKNTHIYTCTYECDEEKLLHEVANNDNIELKEEEDRLEVELTADIKIECNDDIKEDNSNSDNKECNDNINEQHNYNSDNDSDYNDTELKIEKEDNIKKSTRDKKKLKTIAVVTESSSDNDSDYNDKDFKIYLKENKIDKSSKVTKKNNSLWNEYKNLALVTKRLDVKKNYFQYTKSVCLSQKEYEIVLKRDYISQIKKMRFKCNKCQQFFKRKLDLLRHISFQHNEQTTFPCKCEACDTMISSTEHLDEHWTENHTKMLKCTLCSKVYHTKPEIRKHIWKEHTKKYSCKQCGLEFGTLSGFKKHCRVVHVSVICDYCNSSFSQKRFLLRHIRLSHLPVYCKQCDRTYKNQKNFKAHNIFIHPELTAGETRKELSYCVECDKQFPSVYSYQRHLIDSSQHTPKTKLPCPECGKVLSKSYMESHISFFHLKAPKNYCKQCDKYYARSSGLKDHIARHHKKIALPKNKYCDICGRGFSTNKILQNHRRTHTGERPYKCSFCPAAFAQKTAMTSHQKSQHKNLDLPS